MVILLNTGFFVLETNELVFKVVAIVIFEFEDILFIVLLLIEIEPSDIVEIIFSDL